MAKELKKKVKVKIRNVPKKQVDNPGELHPTKDGILRVTPENVPMATVMFLNQIRDSNIRQEKLLAALLKEVRDGD